MSKEETGGARGRFRQLDRLPETTPLSTFLRRIDKKSRLSRKDRLRILDQALLLLEMNYVHLPLKRAMHAIDPIRRLKLLKYRLEETENEMETEVQFHKRLLEIFASLRDLHTHYQLPATFANQMAFLPFLVEQYFVPNKAGKPQNRGARKTQNNSGKEKLEDKLSEKFMVSHIARHFYRSTASAPPEVTNFEPGVEVLFWNGMPIRRAIEMNGETQSGSNLAARFGRGLDSLTIRSLETSLPPDESWVSITYRTKTGQVFTLHEQEWRVGVLDGSLVAFRTSPKRRAAIDVKKTKINLLKKKLYRETKPSEVVRELRVRKEFAETFYAEAREVYGREIGYVRLYSFDTETPDRFVEEFKRVITSKNFPQGGLIIDVRGNGGGKIRAGERLLQLFTPGRIKPELFEFINTPLNLEICKRAPKNWELAKWAKSIAESVETGARYSMGFPLNDEKSCNDIGQVYHGPVILITDALSYSTTDMFAAGFQDNEVGLILGTSDNTGAGGANNWTYEDLKTAVRNGPNSPFKPLPKGADLVVSMRRSIRVGPRVGKLLEELGIEPDKRHYMTKRDLLMGNIDLIKHAVRLLNERPIYSVSVKPFKRKTSAGVIISANSKVPPQKSVENIAYLDIYFDGRLLKTLDAKDGAITTKAVFPRGKRKREVLVQAFDGTKKLVAAYRYK